MPVVRDIVQWLERFGATSLTLLVIPGAGWDERSLDSLRSMVAVEGREVAGHGWSHTAPEPSTFGHRLHAALLSRDQAEHLSRPGEEVASIIERCHEWFGDAELPVPQLYVPPAWALGRLDWARLSALPFRWYELLRGYVRAADGSFWKVPLLGFEADNRARQIALAASNRLNDVAARLMRRPVRIAIHPSDLRLHLANALEAVLRQEWHFSTAASALDTRSRAAVGSRDTWAV